MSQLYAEIMGHLHGDVSLAFMHALFFQYRSFDNRQKKLFLSNFLLFMCMCAHNLRRDKVQSHWGLNNKSLNLYKKAIPWRILVEVVEWRHRENGWWSKSKAETRIWFNGKLQSNIPGKPGVLLGILGGRLPPGSPNPGLMSDQKMSFTLPFWDLVSKKLCHHYLD